MLFADKSPPDLVREYDVLGFDADHCIVKYNIPALTTLLVKITAEDLVKKKGYPEQLLEADSSLDGIGINNIIWDIEHRCLIKLGEGKIVTHALRGTVKLT